MDSVVSAARRADETAGALSSGGQHASGAGRADGGAVGPRSSRARERAPAFDEPVPRNGYAWWYVDALSDDGTEGITIIAFIGSVFSPYYKFARRRGPVDPLNHCAINVVLYRPGRGRWAMTERPASSVTRTDNSFSVGPSALRWEGDTLVIDIDEVTMPIPSRLRGKIRVTPQAITQGPFLLTEGSAASCGQHQWWPVAPKSRVEVIMQSPGVSWSGDGYFDYNCGDGPVEDGFRFWEWSRGTTQNNGAVILYEGERRDGTTMNLAKVFDRDGRVQDFTPPDKRPLKHGLWRVGRSVRSETPPRVINTLEDAPFYTRSVIGARLNGEDLTMMHESLFLDRFNQPIVQVMLPFRMPRALR
jgi:carotenoid 1,2-hydratase